MQHMSVDTMRREKSKEKHRNQIKLGRRRIDRSRKRERKINIQVWRQIEIVVASFNSLWQRGHVMHASTFSLFTFTTISSFFFWMDRSHQIQRNNATNLRTPTLFLFASLSLCACVVYIYYCICIYISATQINTEFESSFYFLTVLLRNSLSTPAIIFVPQLSFVLCPFTIFLLFFL